LNSNSILIVAGEVSGDIHGGKLVEAIKELAPDIKIAGIGGENMSSAGMELLRNVNEMSFLGFTEIIKHLPFVRKVMKELLNWIEKERPKVVVLIDYPGFNLRLAKKAKKFGCKIIYYISPQIWAWGERQDKNNRPYSGPNDRDLSFRRGDIPECGRPCGICRASDT